MVSKKVHSEFKGKIILYVIYNYYHLYLYGFNLLSIVLAFKNCNSTICKLFSI